ncbi:MAG: hypothetical protein M3Q73_03005 [bacterium]|nr:hypothetical protein [bacterium]
MKKIFAYILITLILITPFFAAQQTAQAIIIGGLPAAAVAGAPAMVAQAAAGEVATWFKGIVSWGAYISLLLSAALAGIAGVLLEESIQFSVVTMSATIDAYPAINYGWSLVRDLGNFVFIFALLYVAFTTIFGMADGNTMKLIRNIIIVGLLVNFSLFFTKILIDASNILSLVFYSQFATAGAATGDGTLDAAIDTVTMTEKLAGFLKIQSLFNATTAQATLSNNDWIPLLTLGFGGTIFFLSTAFSFFYAAFLFLLRFLMLIILLILSPIGFLGYMLPATSGLAKKWWNLLAAQLAFAPLYMLLISVVFLLAGGMDKIYPAGAGGLDGVLKTISGAGESREAAGAVVGGAVSTSGNYSDVIGPIVNFIVIIGLINAAAIISTVVATNTSGFVGGMRDRSRVWLGRSTFGTAGAVGRNTIGRAAYGASNSQGLRDRAAMGGFRGLMARGVLSGSKNVSERSFDARATNTLKKSGFGDAGGKKGFVGGLKATEDRLKKRQKLLDDGDVFRHADGRIVTGTSLYKQAWKAHSNIADKIKRKEEADKMYRDMAKKQTEELGFEKVSRKQMFAESVREGNLLQKISTLGSRRLYQATYAGHFKASEGMWKEIKNKKDKQELPKLKSQKSDTTKQLNKVQAEKRELEEEKNNKKAQYDKEIKDLEESVKEYEELLKTASTDDEKKVIAKDVAKANESLEDMRKKAAFDDRAKKLTERENKLSKEESDIEEKIEKINKASGKKDGEDKKKKKDSEDEGGGEKKKKKEGGDSDSE